MKSENLIAQLNEYSLMFSEQENQNTTNVDATLNGAVVRIKIWESVLIETRFNLLKEDFGTINKWLGIYRNAILKQNIDSDLRVKKSEFPSTIDKTKLFFRLCKFLEIYPSVKFSTEILSAYNIINKCVHHSSENFSISEQAYLEKVYVPTVWLIQVAHQEKTTTRLEILSNFEKYKKITQTAQLKNHINLGYALRINALEIEKIVTNISTIESEIRKDSELRNKFYNRIALTLSPRIKSKIDNIIESKINTLEQLKSDLTKKYNERH